MGDIENDEGKRYDVQSVKDRLTDFRNMNREIDNEIERLDRLQSKMYSVGSPQITDMPRSSSPSNDKMTSIVARKMELEEKIKEMIRSQEEERKKLEDIINRIKKPDERAVIRMRYLDIEDWSDVCFTLYGGNDRYEEKEQSYMRRLMLVHGRALLCMAKIIEES